VVIAINNDNRSVAFDVDVSPLLLADGTMLSDRLGRAGEVRVENRKLTMNLPARTAAILAGP